MPHAHDHAAVPARRPDCPFCGVPWTEGMMAEYERFSTTSCGCCGHGEAEAPPAPEHDLCCDACGKPIYRMSAAD